MEIFMFLYSCLNIARIDIIVLMIKRGGVKTMAENKQNPVKQNTKTEIANNERSFKPKPLPKNPPKPTTK